MGNFENRISVARFLRRVTLLILILIGTGGCRTQSESGDALPHSDINTVMEAHVGDLMAIPGVTGVAVGELEDGTPCILILILEQTEELEEKLPKQLDGRPVRVMVTGEIKPMDSG